jgi:hypothetical protein
VLRSVEHDVLTVAVLETSLYKALSALQSEPATGADARASGLRAELAQLDAEVGRLAAAIAGGGELPALLGALQERERRRAHLRGELARRERELMTAARGRLDAEGFLGELRERLTDWQGMLRQETGRARHALRALLAGRLIFTPQERDGEPFYRFAGHGTVSAVIAGMVAARNGCGVPDGIRTRVSRLKIWGPRPG